MSSSFTPSVVGAFSARAISGDITGTAVPAGYIGEKIAATITANTSTAGASGINPEVDVAGASITLSPGNWMLYYYGTVFQSILASGGNLADARLRITTSANVHVANSATLSSNPYNGSSTAWSMHKLHACFVPVDISSATTYKLRLQANFDGTTGSCRFLGDPASGTITGFTDSDAGAAFYAIRIA